MAKLYDIWDKKTNIITPTMNVYTPEQWMEKNPAAAIDDMVVVCSAGTINGGYIDLLPNLLQAYEERGVDFSECASDEERIALIHAFEDEKRAARAAAAIAEADAEAAAAAEAQELAERQTAALEYLAIASLPDEDAE